MNNMRNIIKQNHLISERCSKYEKALNLAMEGLENLKTIDTTNISELTIFEIKKILNKKK